MKNLIKTFLKDEAGASAAEYALILAVVGVAIGGAALALGDVVGDAIADAATDVNNCTGATTTNCTAHPNAPAID
ncbi:Flp family type IVb pilin [Erythrobacter sp. sf7]|uniref:Flp family type IVb pilin n=1 Tax=Erythrobacter fulvus TaxID=2987523 RepID=A0ABT5JPV7_9SPHN|nr:Flp family type IVb pilin [Erythrobacter fulvus]MDC8754805.1 Flp family type IVb pilin [Erythrobacter fulvus]